MAEREKNGQEGIFCACGNRGDVPGERVNLRRIREKLDALEAAGDTEGAARLLNYWIAEAQFIGDRTGEALLENEFVGMYRKAGRGAEALRHGDRALSLLEAGGLEDTVTAGTTRINVATACTAFGQEERACLLFEQARKIYEARLDATDERLGGLYNNMGLCMISLGRFAEGRQLFDQALAVMSTVPCGEGEAAVTCLNLADLSSAEAEAAGDEESLIRAAEETERLVERAWALLNTSTLPRDAAYRFICEKCAPVMAHYGRLDWAEALRKRAGKKEAGDEEGC